MMPEGGLNNYTVITVCKTLISSLSKMTENTTCGFGCHRFNLGRQMSNGRLYNV